MKCPHCGKDIADNLVVSEAARIHGRRSRRQLSSEDAREMAEARHRKSKRPPMGDAGGGSDADHQE